ncbi:hypothetical protein Patl1_36216 [Pistacia atlantica]|nr:hypothetical protein Patl1_36216 [Pistacia atlantica]
MKEKRLFDILDAQVKQHGNKDEIMVFANLAKRCLSQNGKERPTMKEIVKELEGIQLSKKKKVPFKLAVLTEVRQREVDEVMKIILSSIA